MVLSIVLPVAWAELQVQGALAPVEANDGARRSNTCNHAYDGECDEPTYCTSGTDTFDCGTSSPTGSTWAPTWAPTWGEPATSSPTPTPTPSYGYGYGYGTGSSSGSGDGIDIGIIIGAAGGGVVLIGIGIFVYCKCCRDKAPDHENAPGITPSMHQTPTENNPVSHKKKVQANPDGPTNPDELRAEDWYDPYFQSVTDACTEVERKYPKARIKIIGVQPDNHDTYGARTRLEWTCLQEDTNDALRRQEKKGMKKQLTEVPEFQRVKFANLQEEIDRANQDEKKTQIIVASCPRQIGNDEQIMQQVEAMIGSSVAVTKCFSYYGNMCSMIGEKRAADGNKQV